MTVLEGGFDIMETDTLFEQRQKGKQKDASELQARDTTSSSGVQLSQPISSKSKIFLKAVPSALLSVTLPILTCPPLKNLNQSLPQLHLWDQYIPMFPLNCSKNTGRGKGGNPRETTVNQHRFPRPELEKHQLWREPGVQTGNQGNQREHKQMQKAHPLLHPTLTGMTL